VQERILVLAVGGRRTSYAYVLAQLFHEKVSLSFPVSEGDVLSERKLDKFVSLFSNRASESQDPMYD